MTGPDASSRKQWSAMARSMAGQNQGRQWMRPSLPARLAWRGLLDGTAAATV
jgi:hypothetical protein